MLSDWGNTLMSEAGPTDIPMPDWPEVRTIDGAREVLSLLSKSYRIAMVSKKRDVVRALEKGGLNAFISEIFCFTELRYKKSEPEFWDTVLTRVGAQKNELAMIGDSLEHDVLGPMRRNLVQLEARELFGIVLIRSIQSLRQLPAAIEEFG